MYISSRHCGFVVSIGFLLSACGGGGGDGGDPLAGKQTNYSVGGALTLENAPGGQAPLDIRLVDALTCPSNTPPDNCRGITLNAAGNFTFASLPTNTSYQLDVRRQPAGFSCRVERGNGIVNTAAVTDIAVICAAGQFSIRGTVSGLGNANSGMQISNNADSRNVSDDGPFTFSATNGSSYNVRIATTHPHYQCTLRDSAGQTVQAITGTISAADITGISIACVAPVTVTVSGLPSTSSPGLTLANSYGTDASNATRAIDLLAIPNSGAHTFGARLPSGRAYTITVGAHHPDFDCAVSNGSGTVGATAINVSVVCVPVPAMIVASSSPTHGAVSVSRTIHPSISFSAQLNISTVTTSSVTLLSQHGAETISLVATGNQITVTPARPLRRATNYSLNISTAVRGNANKEKLAAPAAISFTTSDEFMWQTPALIETDNTSYASNPQVVFDANGNATAVWKQHDGTRTNIWSNRYTAASGAWGTATPIETDNAGDASAPQIACSANGNAIAVWEQSDGTRTNIWSNRYAAASGTWGTATPIETDNAGDAAASHVSCDLNGNAIAVWRQSDGTRTNIWSNRYTAASGAWGTATLIENDNIGGAGAARIALNATGSAAAVWAHSDGTRYHVWSNRYMAAAGIWGTATRIELDNAGSANAPQIANYPDGNAIAVWTKFDGTRYNILSNFYIAANAPFGWGTAVPIENDNAGDAINPQIVLDTAGNAVAVWAQSDGTQYSIWSNRYTAASGTWGTATPIETNAAGYAADPQIASDANNNALAVWAQSDGTRTNIWSNRYTAASGAWGTAALIETDNLGDARNPQIAIDAIGNAVAVWWQSDGMRFNIQANRFD